MANISKHALLTKEKFQLKKNVQFTKEQQMVTSNRDIITTLYPFNIKVTQIILSWHVWHLCKENTRSDLTWSIEALTSPCKCRSYRCNLCLTEKLFIGRWPKVVIQDTKTNNNWETLNNYFFPRKSIIDNINSYVVYINIYQAIKYNMLFDHLMFF